MIKAVIVDDDQNSIDKLTLLIAEYCNDIDIIGVYKSVEDGIEGIKKVHPDLIFLDVILENRTGFDLLEGLKKNKEATFSEANFKVIFVTAFDEFAIKAIEFSAFRYLLKPVNPDKLRKSIDDLDEIISKEIADKKIEVLLNYVKGEHAKIKNIVIQSTTGLVMVQVGEIMWCTGKGNCTEIYTKSQEKITVTKTLKIFEKMLEEYSIFFRAHKSNLINLTYVKKYKDGSITMSDAKKTIIALSEDKEAEFRKRLSAL